MSSRDIRSAVLDYLVRIDEKQSIQPAELALRLQLPAEHINPFLRNAQVRDEIAVLPDGSVKLSERMRKLIVEPQYPQLQPKPVTLDWNVGQTWEKVLIVVSSVIFIGVFLFYGILYRGNIGDRQFIILRTVLALAGAGFTIGFPGFIEVEIVVRNKNKIQAIGASAIFVCLFFFLPKI